MHHTKKCKGLLTWWLRADVWDCEAVMPLGITFPLIPGPLLLLHFACLTTWIAEHFVRNHRNREDWMPLLHVDTILATLNGKCWIPYLSLNFGHVYTERHLSWLPLFTQAATSTQDSSSSDCNKQQQTWIVATAPTGTYVRILTMWMLSFLLVFKQICIDKVCLNVFRMN